MSRCIHFFTLFLALASSTLVTSKRYDPTWASIDTRPLPSWYDRAKIGIFLHWGVYSVPSFHPSGEWFWAYWGGSGHTSKVYNEFMAKNYPANFTYQEFAPSFKAEFYNPQKWAQLFRKAGARYVVLTSKHHEGYTLWPSKRSPNWNVGDVGPKRDLLGDLAAAIRAENLTFGAYYSLYEWHHPLYNADKAAHFKTNEFVRTKMQPEMEDLVSTYKPSVIWVDGDWEASDTYFNSTHFLAWLYNDSPVKDSVVVNDRWGKGIPCLHGDFRNCKDRYAPNTLQPHKWESAWTLDKSSWGYRREAQLAEYKTTQELIEQLVITVSCGGNLLINVGPTCEGTIVSFFEERLLELGAWLAVNGESVYESSPWSHQNDTISKNLWYTTRAGHVYGTVSRYPSTGKVEFGAIEHSKVKSVTLLGHHPDVPFTKATDGHVKITFPNLSPLTYIKHAYVFKFTFK